MLISISEVLETPISTLLGETVIETEVDNLKAISEKLEVINLQLAQRKYSISGTANLVLLRLLQNENAASVEDFLARAPPFNFHNYLYFLYNLM